MIPQEVMKANMQEWTREAARLQLQSQARECREQDGAPDHTAETRRIRQLSLPALFGHVFRSAPTA